METQALEGSAVSTLLSSISPSFCNAINLVLQSITPSNNDSITLSGFVKFVSYFPLYKSQFEPVFEKCASLLINNTESGYQSLRLFFPIVSLSSKDPVFSCNKASVPWLSKVIKRDDSDMLYRFSLFYFIENSVSCIMSRVCKLGNSDIINSIIPKYIDDILKIVTGQFSSQLLFLSVYYFEELFYYYSINCPIESWQLLLRLIATKDKDPSNLSFIFGSLSSYSVSKIVFSKELIAQSQPAFAQLMNDYNETQTMTQHLTQKGVFISNIVSGMIKSPINNRPSEIIQQIYQSNSQNIKNPQSYPITCTFFTLTSDERVKTTITQLLNSANNIFYQVPGSEYLTLFSLKKLLCGNSYEVPYILNQNHDNVNWRIDKRDISQLQIIFKLVMKQINISLPQKLLGQFIFQYAVSNVYQFINNYLDDIFESKFYARNSQAVYEACRDLILYLDPSETEVIRTKASSFLATLLPKFVNETRCQGVVGIPNFDCSVTSIIESSLPTIFAAPHIKKMSSDVAKLHKLVSKEKKSPVTFEITNSINTTKTLQLFDMVTVYSFAFFTVIDFSDAFIQCLVQNIYNANSFISVLSAKILHFIVKEDSFRLDNILGLIIKEIPLTNEQIAVRLLSIIYILDGYIQREKILTDSVLQILSPIIFIGLSSCSFEIRSITLDLLLMFPQFETFLFDQKASITSKVLLKISNIFGGKIDIGSLNALNLQQFESFVVSGYEFLYYTYYTVFLEEVSKSSFSSLLVYSLNPVVDSFNKMIKSTIGGSFEMGLIYLATFIICNWKNRSNITILENIITNSVQTIEKNISNDPWQAIFLVFASSINSENLFTMLKLIGVEDDYKINAFFFALSHFSQQLSIFDEPKQLEDYLTILDGLLEKWDKNNIFAINNITKIDISSLAPSILENLIGFLKIVSILCSQFFKLNSGSKSGPIQHHSFCSNSIKREKWFPFMISLAISSINTPIFTYAEEAFSSYCSVTIIPDNLFGTYLQHIISIANVHTIACSHILSRSVAFLLPTFIMRSLTEPSFFACMALLFPPIKGIRIDIQELAEMASNPITPRDLDFYRGIYSNLGRIISLGLLYLSGDIQGFENYALQMLYHLSLSSILLSPSGTDHSKLISFFENYITNIESNGSVMSFSQLLNLSDSISCSFKFCSEQFIHESFTILSHKMFYSFACLLEPWFKAIRLSVRPGENVQNNSENRIISIVPDTPPVFVSYSAISFLEVFLRNIITTPILPPIKSLITALAANNCDLEMIFVFIINSFSSYKEQCITLLSYILTIHPQYANYVLSFLQFRFWYYSVIQLRTFDRFFDFERFLGEFKSRNGAEKSESKASDIDVTEISYYILEIIVSLTKQSKSFEEQFLPYIMSYSIVQPKDKNGRLSNALITIFNTEYPIPDDVINRLNKAQLEIFSKELFMWATTCGDINIAIKSLSFATSFVEFSDPSLIGILLRTLKIIVISLYEHNNPNQTKKQQKHLTILLQGEEMSVKIYYKYIGLVIELLWKVANHLHTAPLELIVSLCEFSLCSDKEYYPVFDNMIDGLSSVLKYYIHNPSSNIPEVGGILAQIAQSSFILEKKRSSSIVAETFHVCAQLASYGLFGLLFPKKTAFVDALDQFPVSVSVSPQMAAAATILYLLPYFSSNCTESMFKSISAQVQSICSINISPLWNAFHNDEDIYGKSVTQVVSSLASISQSTLVAMVVKLYSQSLSQSPSIAPAIYLSASVLYPIVPTIKGFMRIAVPGLKEKVYLHLESLTRFLNEYQKNGQFGLLPKIELAGTFPVQNLPFSFDIKNWNPTEETNQFTSIEHLPPLYPTECGFYYFDIISELRNRNQTVQIVPFTDWANLYYLAESVKNVDCTVSSAEIDIFDANIEQLTTILKDTNKTESQVSLASNQLRQSMSYEFDTQKPQFDVQIDDILPTMNEIEAIGSPLFNKY